VLSPNPDDEGVWIYQDAWFHMGKFDNGFSTEYKLKKSGNGIYAFVLNGDITIGGITLNNRDALGIWDTEAITITAASQDAELLLIEIPMTL
jgi:redox-sensitive bicupin YhaK (pirin superfamily)